MSSRALRKAQREREEAERVTKLEQEQLDESEENVTVQTAKQSAFALLGEQETDGDIEGSDENDDGAENDDEDGGVELPEDLPTTPTSKPPNKKKTRKKKKKRQVNDEKQAPGPKEEEQQLDEIDKALKALSSTGNTSLPGATTAGTDATTDASSRLLAVDSSHLQAQSEMRRLFGRAALDPGDEDQPPAHGDIAGNRRQQRRVRQVGLAQALRGRGGAAGARYGGLAALASRRNIFMRGKEEWPAATGGGLSMEVEERRVDGTVLYKFVHNTVYQDVQAQFEMAVESMDPQRLVVLLQHNPYHISTLLQVSEIAKQERDHATSGDLLERALFSFGRAAHSTFAKAVGEGKARLDFRRAENRELWLASWRYMQNLGMRATWRTVYEWAKLLLSLSPDDDPYALWLVLDQYALRARQDLDYLNISRHPAFKDVHKDMPNIRLSQGLAEFRAGNAGKGKQALFAAVGRFPWVVTRLMRELQLDPPLGIWGKEPRTDKETLYTELYATHAKDLWNTPEASSLLLEIASAVQPETPAAPVDYGKIQQKEARHVLLSDTSALISFVPREFTAALRSTSDPLPPSDAYPSYLASMSRNPRAIREVDEGSPADNLRELQGLHHFFSNLFPWFNRPNPSTDAPAGDTPPHPTAEEIERLIRQSGIDEGLIVERTRRLVELRQRLGGTELNENGGIEDEEGLEVLVEGAEDGEERARRARVEDVEDSGD